MIADIDLAFELAVANNTDSFTKSGLIPGRRYSKEISKVSQTFTELGLTDVPHDSGPVLFIIFPVSLRR